MPEWVSFQNFFYLSMPVIAIYGLSVWRSREEKKFVLRFQENLHELEQTLTEVKKLIQAEREEP